MQKDVPTTPVPADTTFKLRCHFYGDSCKRSFKSTNSLTKHMRSAHRNEALPRKARIALQVREALDTVPDSSAFEQDEEMSWSEYDDEDDEGITRRYHPGLSARPCDEKGQLLAKDTPLPPRSVRALDDFSPFDNRTQFEMADFLYTRSKMSAKNIAFLSILWAATLVKYDDSPPFLGTKPLYDKVDSIPLSDVAWNMLSFTASNSLQDANPVRKPWMMATYDIWYRDPRAIIHNMLANPDFDGEFDYTPMREHLPKDAGLHRKNFMSSDWAWDQADEIAENPKTHGLMFVPIILSSDKTTVSVATGQNEYYLLYASIENVHNNVRRAHWNAVALIGFFAIPKRMETPEVVRCPEGHFHKAMYGIGPYIADYPEQVLLAYIVCNAEPPDIDKGGGFRWKAHTEAIIDQLEFGEMWEGYSVVGDITPFTSEFPCADIHELLAPDILHQLIKGTFKDHLVSWVEEYLVKIHGRPEADRILADIDRRIAVAPPFSNLRRFPEGRGFKQWTGDDSKALMKVWLPAIAGYVPAKMVKAISAFLDFCYIAHRNVHTPDSIKQLDDALRHFHKHRIIFQTSGVRPAGFALPRQHSLMHYKELIIMYGAPNRLCSSITESKHIKAVKEPWRQSNKYKALGQILLTNQRLDKLAAILHFFVSSCVAEPSFLVVGVGQLRAINPDLEDMLLNGCPSEDKDEVMAAKKKQQKPAEDLGDVDGPAHPQNVQMLSAYIHQPQLLELIQRFLRVQTQPNASHDSIQIRLDQCPIYRGKIYTYHSATATYFAPSDPCGVGGMHREHIRGTPSWYHGSPRFDCVFLEPEQNCDSINRFGIARLKLLFSIKHQSVSYPCALVHWYEVLGDAPDNRTGMWIIKLKFHDRRRHNPHVSVVHLDTLLRAAHLMPCFGRSAIGVDIRAHYALNRFKAFYLNKYIDHHACRVSN
ncbi:hypothetical protein OBBRIDRAFT_815526 [Obba rivulosa]|uniref:C2H2-type domain-containing protein n=1 Tax=Obba rivulosa TaxID=1052685 RepID=A0A8E2ALY0_9APHY|nr:hypothetical protein OBBRIDRAFT_815526 [Obba rivulosa]